MSLRLRSLRLWSLGLVVLGCNNTDDPAKVAISHTDAALLAQQNTERALLGLIDASGHLTESQTLARVLSAFAGSSESCESSSAPTTGTTTTGTTTTAAGGTASTTTDTSTTSTGGTTSTTVATTVVTTLGTTNTDECTLTENAVTLDDLAELRTDLVDATGELIAFMRDELFTESNLESDDGKTSVYKLQPALFCDESADDPTIVSVGGATSAAAATVSLDAECVANVEKMAPRLVLSSPSEGNVDMTLTLTSQKLTAVSFELYADHLGANVDLGALQQASSAAGVPLEGIAGLTGTFHGLLQANGALDYTVSVGIDDALSALFDDAPQQVALKLAASPTVASLNFNGNTRRTEGALNLGRVELSAPLGAFFSDDEENYDEEGYLIAPKTYTGTVTAVLAGLTGNISYDGATDVFALENMGIGADPFVIKHEDATLVSASVNANAGGVFDVSLGAGDENGPELSFSSELDANVILGFSAIASQVADLEGYLLGDNLKLLMTGSRPTVRLEQEQIRVVEGTLEVSSQTQTDYSVVAATGQCLLSAESEATPTSLAGLFAAGTCQ